MSSDVPFWISLVLVASAVVIAAGTWVGYHRTARSLQKRPWSSLFVGAFLAGWLTVALVLAVQGFFQPGPLSRLPGIVYSFVPLVLGFVAASAVTRLRTVIAAVPPAWVVGVQVYRALGLLFLILYFQGQLPGAFALPAGIGDVLVGVTAPVVAFLLRAKHRWSRGFAVLWNVVGIADLVVALTMGFLSSPGPFQVFALQSPNALITAFPLVIVPAFAVPLSILLHLFSLRVLVGQKK